MYIHCTIYQVLIRAAHKLILHTSFGNEEFLAYEFHNIITYGVCMYSHIMSDAMYH